MPVGADRGRGSTTCLLKGVCGMCRGGGGRPSPLGAVSTATAATQIRTGGKFAKPKGRVGLHRLTGVNPTAAVAAGLVAAQRIKWGCVPPGVAARVLEACGKDVLDAAISLHTAAIGGRGSDRAFKSDEARDRYLGDYLNCEEIALHADCRDQAAGVAATLASIEASIEAVDQSKIIDPQTRCLQVNGLAAPNPPATNTLSLWPHLPHTRRFKGQACMCVCVCARRRACTCVCVWAVL